MLSTKAGGLGLNLQSAKQVVIFDSDWNPQNDIQAIARAHRIGQTQEVKVFRLLTEDSYEQLQYERASQKLSIERAVLNDNLACKQSKKQVEELLKYGVLQLMKQNRIGEVQGLFQQQLSQQDYKVEQLDVNDPHFW